ncbi:MAG: CCA tRNA nucleotidyltransferase [Ruminococcus sp.]|nr:CCA tRNA nucleotidyltransferase [Ruminococcus sp.]
MILEKNCCEILSALEKAGFSAYIVGGCVRDTIMGIPIHDYDITTNALPKEIIEVFSGHKVIPTGIKHGTVTVLHNNEPFEITTFRIDGEYTDSRRPDNVIFTASLYEDLARRDFTMNAIAMDMNGNIYDPFCGEEDIRNGVIRCVGNPTERFTEDALRILRAIRFSSILGFDIEENTSDAIHTLKTRLNNISSERIFVELMKLLAGKKCVSILLEYRDIIGQIIPELVPAFDFEQHSPYHKYNVYEHIVRSVNAVPRNINGADVLRLTMLLHDVGKPDTFKLDENGRGHFKGHAKVSAEKAKDILQRLKTDNKTLNTVYDVIYLHSDKIDSEKYIKRIINKIGFDKFLLLIEAKKADNSAKHSFVLAEIEELDGFINTARRLVEENACMHISDLAINGTDLMELGFKGKDIGECLNSALQLIIDEKLVNSREKLLEYAQEMKK